MARIIIKNGVVSSSAGVEFQMGASASFFISSSGVGIGTDEPSASLDIETGHVLLPETMVTPTLPPPGKGALYMSGSDSHIYLKNDLGEVYDLTDTSEVSGSTGVSVRDEGVDLPNSPYSTINFVGSLVSASDDGGVAKVELTLRKALFYIDNGPVEDYTSSYSEILPAGDPFPTSSIWYEDSSKAKKIWEETISYVSGVVKPTPITYKLYDEDGSTVLVTIQDSITYSGIFEINRTRTITYG